MDKLFDYLYYLWGQLFGFFSSLISTAVDALTGVIADTFRLPPWVWKAFSFVSWVAATWLASMITAMGIIGDAIKDMIALLDKVKSGDGLVPDQSTVTGATDLLAFANTFFPLETLFSYLVVLSVAYLAATTVRVLKSWIPTIG